MSAAAAAIAGSTGAGATDSNRIPLSWTFRAIGKVAVEPSRPRATMTESSASKSISRSASSTLPGGRPSAASAPSISSAAATRIWPRPS